MSCISDLTFDLSVPSLFVHFRTPLIVSCALRLILVLIVLSPWPAYASEIRLAVASNFTAVAKTLKLEFEKQSEHTISLSFASTGKLYAQIKNGAPFDVFLAADTERPELLEREGFVVADNRFTYALGQLVLWSSSQEGIDLETLSQADFRNLAIANPKLAPYGRAAEQVLRTLDLNEQLQDRLVFAENVAQAFAFIHTGNADLGFIAKSQLLGEAFDVKDTVEVQDKAQVKGNVLAGSFWQVPQNYHEPIEQQAILLSKKTAAAEFLLFLMNDKARTIIANAGFNLP